MEGARLVRQVAVPMLTKAYDKTIDYNNNKVVGAGKRHIKSLQIADLAGTGKTKNDQPILDCSHRTGVKPR